MIAFALVAVALAAAQEPAVFDVPVYQNAAVGVALPRPFGDWVFAPATDRGTTTVIFQPRDGSLSDQLWGALVLAPFARGVPLEDIADRRIASSWRAALGANYALLARDSVELDGLPAIHIVMSGAINLAVLEVEEYLLMRDSTLIVLQFRYPRGQPRDSIAAGYARALGGLRIRAPLSVGPSVRPSVLSVGPPVRPSVSPWTVTIDRGLILFDLPSTMRAIAPGALTSEVVAGDRRTMRWSPTIGRADTTLYAVGRFRGESRRVGRLTVRIWRSESQDAAVTRVNDEVIRFVADEWARYWRLFGPVPTTELALVETAWPETRGGPAVLYLGADAGAIEFNDWNVRRELSRTWWGGLVRNDPTMGTLVSEALPAWSAMLVWHRNAPRGDPTRGRSDVRAVVQVANAAGEPRFREAIRTLTAESRDGGPALPSFLRVLGDSAAALIRPLLR